MDGTGAVVGAAAITMGPEGVIEDAALLFHEGLLTYVGPRRAAPQTDGTVLDATGCFVMPGFWDTHVHLNFPGLPQASPSVSTQDLLESTLLSGVTSVLDLTGDCEQLAAVRCAERLGPQRGPRVFFAGRAFTAPGSHPSATVFREDRQGAAAAIHEVSSPHEAVGLVRSLCDNYDVDVIKAFYTDGSHGPVRFPQLDLEVLAAIVAEAHAQHRCVFVHVDTAAAALDAVDAGADGVEHAPSQGFGVEFFERAGARSTFWTPTLAVFDAGRAHAAAGWFEEQNPERLLSAAVVAAAYDSRRAAQIGTIDFGGDRIDWALDWGIKAAAAAGIRIVVGTDAGLPWTLHGLAVHRELELLVSAGLSPLEALESATVNAAAKLGNARSGALRPGADADAVVVEADPLANISNTRQIRSVIKRGIFYR